ncbi:MAG: recombination regulator RecX [Actinobacteria bacterium]|jgi:regulatory protein|uniref:Regulatory protein RecX n=1 Tax=freshwater metagenome TaxID=449393 RepID=A0A6J6GQP3_9ZZZZ|nr:recombination regulator RecX [Actinomycetota bacterium]
MAFARRGRSRIETNDSEPAPLLSPEKQESRARNVLLYQLSKSAKSKDQCRKILANRGIDSEIAEKVLDRFEEAQIIDDAVFARAFTNSRIRGKGLAKTAIARELREKGVDQELIETALQELDNEGELARATELAVNRVRRMGHLEKLVIQRRLSGFLARKGYAGSIVQSATRVALEEAVKLEV